MARMARGPANSFCEFQMSSSSYIYKLNLNIEYPSPYERLDWDYEKAHTDNIKKSIESVNYEFLLNNKTVNRQVSIFNETIINTFFNFVPNKLVTFNDSGPPWTNDFLKNKIKWKHQIHKTYKKWSHSDYLKLQEVTSVIS